MELINSPKKQSVTPQRHIQNPVGSEYAYTPQATATAEKKINLKQVQLI